MAYDSSNAAGVRRRDAVFDVAICGGGLAGLTFAIRVRKEWPDLRVVLIDRLSQPLPESAFKVGESSIEIGAHYFADVLQLKEHFETCQLEKLGLRYFYQSPGGSFASRPEFGVASFLPAKSYQIDRGILETHLRCAVAASGVQLEEGCSVKRIELHSDAPHVVEYSTIRGQIRRVSARWVIDASGRRRFLQRQLGLGVQNRFGCNASWFRIDGKLDVSSLVPASETAWHSRVRESRWHSTNHMMGPGYWVWLIPLSPGNTSVGIVALNSHHDIAQYSTLPRARAWIRAHEPEVDAALEDYRVLDFLTLKGYSYSSTQAFSIDRWACIGEAAVFADPYYSVGSNMIAFGSELVIQMMALDAESRLTSRFVDHANAFFLGLNDSLTETIQSFYPHYGNGVVMALKTIWDYYIGWTITDPRFYQRVFLDVDKSRAVASTCALAFDAHVAVTRVLHEWAARPSTLRFDFIDYMEHLPTLRNLFVRTLPRTLEPWDVVLDEFRKAVLCVEEAAHAIFLLAVRDTMPEKLAELGPKPWLNVKALTLDSGRWSSNGLFRPTTTPRDIEPICNEIHGLFQFSSELTAAY